MRFESREIPPKTGRFPDSRLPRCETKLRSEAKLHLRAKGLEMQIHANPRKIDTDGAFGGTVVSPELFRLYGPYF